MKAKELYEAFRKATCIYAPGLEYDDLPNPAKCGWEAVEASVKQDRLDLEAEAALEERNGTLY